jgi:type III secretion protein V
MNMKRLTPWLSKLAGRHDMILAILLMIAVFMMILPLPTLLIDLLIAVNLMLSIVLLMSAIYIRDPLEFSVFPSLLLITTLYRLALTVSTSRLILLQADAGDVVYAFGKFVVGGNLAVGIVIFSIITIVQFIVITKGAERVAEVSARFTLDAMPGKQMSIDGDMRAGTIDAAEAKRQRSMVQKESQLFGAMDGAMKFVKGDAIAGIIVILVNIIGGVMIGMMQRGMAAGDALNLYAVLSIGDGLIGQIPALIISVAAGIIVTRVPGEQKKNLASDLTTQLGRYPQSLMIGAAVLGIFAIVPGFPFFIFGPLAALVGGGAWWLMKSRSTAASAPASADGKSTGDSGEAGDGKNMRPGADPLSVVIGPQFAHRKALEPSLARLRWNMFERLGLPLPEIPIVVDPTLGPERFKVTLYNEVALSLELPPLILLDRHPHTQAQISRRDTLSFGGVELLWVTPEVAQPMSALGVTLYREEERVAECVARVVRHFAGRFLGVQETRFLMDAMEDRYGELVKELQRQLPIVKVADVLQRLVAEGVSIRDLRTVFESLVEWSSKEKDALMLTEYVRIALRRHIIDRQRGERTHLSCWTIGDSIESQIRDSIRQTAAGAYSSLAPNVIESIVARIEAAVAGRTENDCVIVTAVDTRRFVRKFIERDLSLLPVLSYQELADDTKVNMLGTIELFEEEEDDDAIA